MIITTIIIIILTIIFSIADAGATYAAEIHINLEDIKVRKQINQLSSERPSYCVLNDVIGNNHILIVRNAYLVSRKDLGAKG